MTGSVRKAVRVDCGGKINLYLKVLDRRHDGFHNIVAVYHSISLQDTIVISRRDAGVSVWSSHPGLPLDETNLAYRAAALILEGSSGGVHLEIQKRIPMGAGLGGGSADAAGTLLGVNQLFKLGYSAEQLAGFARQLGADVGFMLKGGCAVGRDMGDRLEPCRALQGVPVLLVVPPLTVDTGWAYDSLKIRLTSPGSSLSMITSALGKGDVASLCDLLENDFEGLIFERFPLVGRIKRDLLRYGARGALMSGSGPVVYGLFTETGEAAACRDQLEAAGYTIILSKLTGQGVTAPRRGC